MSHRFAHLATATLTVMLLTAMPLTAAPALCQEKKGAESLETKLENLLKEPFFQKAQWITDYDAARAEAKKSGKPIFAYFTRSYAF